ncbi:MAG: hypothetical protein JWQ71_3638 [Pedosphaera sp.]|nr:hypothetical protein [Pedosphaera sp.]
MVQMKSQSDKTCERIHYFDIYNDVATCAFNAATVARYEFNSSDKAMVGSDHHYARSAVAATETRQENIMKPSVIKRLKTPPNGKIPAL